MDWKELISNKRFHGQGHTTQAHEERSEFKRDYDRLVFSAPFRRMQNKTQVFPLPGSVFVHNRLTHSLEVATVGQSLGSDIARRLTVTHPELRYSLFEEIGTIVSTACLAHDMGNPPFGHSGEKAIQTYFTEGKGQVLKDMVTPAFWDDITHFEGNANAFRILTHRFRGRRDGGFCMTFSTLASIVKYPYVSSAAGEHGKFGFFQSELPYYQQIASELGIRRLSAPGDPLRYARHPLVYLVEAADDICYEIMDIEDSHKLKVITYDEAAGALLGFFDDKERERLRKRIADEGITDENEQIVFLRACVVGKLEHLCVDAFVSNEEKILDGTFQGSLISHIEPDARAAYQRCEALSYDRIYNSKPVLDVELGGYNIMETLMDRLIEAAMNPGRFQSKQLMRRVSSQYDIGSEDLQTRVMAVIDYISGMTDVYALDIYQKLLGISLPIV